MKSILSIILIWFHLAAFTQSLSENDIKQLAQKINDELGGMNMGYGVTVRGCFAVGRTVTYQYSVTEDWYPPENMKVDLIANFKEAGYSEVYFNNDVNVDFHYFIGNKLLKKISIKSYEFSKLNFNLADFICINGHPKAKDVNLKIKYPVGWEIEEGDRPNIVKKFVYKNNSFMIIIKDNITFFSRNEVRELFRNEEYVNQFITDGSSFLRNSEILFQDIDTVDRYPTLVFTMKGEMERSGIIMNLIFKNWIIFYEDKIVYLQCGGLDNKEFYTLEKLYNLITNSVIFPEQYHY